MWKDNSTSQQIGQFGKIKEFAAKFTNKSRAIQKLEMGEETTSNSKHTKKNPSDFSWYVYYIDIHVFGDESLLETCAVAYGVKREPSGTKQR